MKTILRKKAVESHQWWNTAQSILQLGTLTGLLSLLGWLLAGKLGIAFATGIVLYRLPRRSAVSSLVPSDANFAILKKKFTILVRF